MVVYADSSFLVSLSVDDGNSRLAKRYLVRNPAPISFTTFSRSEAHHAIRTMVFKKSLGLDEMTQSLLKFERDEVEGFLRFVALEEQAIFEKADQLSKRHGPEIGVRYLDILHVASALLIGAQRFLTFDARQGELATMTGLQVKP